MAIGATRAALLALAFVFAVSGTEAHAALGSKEQIKCSAAIAKAGINFVKGKLKLIQKCNNSNLKKADCVAPDPAAVTKLETKLASTIEKKCSSFPGGLISENLAAMGFPGACADATPASFTLSELVDCIRTSHADIVDEMIALQYDADLPVPLPSSDDQKCQAEVAKQSGALTLCILKNVQKCRNAINKGKQLGVPIDFCGLDHAKTVASIDKCKAKLQSGITKKCLDAQISALEVCEPNQSDVAGAAACLTDAHAVRTDGIEIAVPPDLIDYEYAVRGGLCGDNVINNLNEECDGTDDGACPGLCGTALVPDGHMACLCKDKSRILVIEDGFNADTDNGWTGQSSDSKVVDEGSYVIDLYDCDGGGLCRAGPHCSDPPHSPCAVAESAPSGTTSDSICIGLGQGTCRKERTAVGPRCYVNPQKKCNAQLPADPACNDAPGDFCQVTFHGAPVGAAAGGVAVCNYSVFSEDIIGTVNINDGTTNVKIRQRARTHQNLVGSQNKPCPVCGGFCAVSRERCETDGDCPGTGPCITVPVCSDGPNQDKPCRNTPPFGGPSGLFGVTSVDCPPEPSTQITSGGGLDINVNPRTTGTAILPPAFACTQAGFTGNTCRGGGNSGAPCTVASQCPGGTCSPQCFCSGQVRPNACDPACVGGGNDAALCTVDSECPGGFCHPADCRLDPFDTDSNEEGICTSGPSDKFCSITDFRTCTTNVQCSNVPVCLGGPNEGASCTAASECPGSACQTLCPFCENGEVCLSKNRACFLNTGIVRQGSPRTPTGASAGAYCVPSNSAAINSGAGFPGGSGLISPETVVVFP